MPVSMHSRISMPKLAKRDKVGVARSQGERLWLISGGLVAFVMVLIGYFFFISPERSNTADVKGNVGTARQQNAVLRARLDALRAQSKDLAKYQAELLAARQALPATSGVPDFLRTLQALGNATQTQVTALSVGQPTDVTPQAALVPTASAAAAPSPTATVPTATATTPQATTGGVGLYAMSISATVTGAPAALIRFLDQLQAVQPRAVLISQITASSGAAGAGSTGSSGSSGSLQLSMQAFVAPATPSAAASLSTASH